MKCSSLARILSTVLLALLFMSVASRAQDIYTEDRPFWEAYKKAKTLGDDKEISRLVKKYRENVKSVLESLTVRLCWEKVRDEDVEDFETLAGVFETVTRNREYTHRLGYLKSLDEVKRAKRYEAHNFYYYGNQKFDEGIAQSNVYTLAEAKGFYAKSIANLEEIKDFEMLGEVAEKLAICCQKMEDHYEACQSFKKSMEAWKQLPYEERDLQWVEIQYNDYIKKGYDPTKPKDEGGAPAEDEGGKSEEGEGVESEEFTFKETGQAETWTLKYCKMKKPDEFETLTFCPGDQPYLWPMMYLDGSDKKQFKPYLYPINIYGKQLNVQRDGVEVTFDIDNEDATKATVGVQEKPRKLSLKSTETDPNGKPQQYQLFVSCPGAQESMFSLQTNLAPQPTWMYIRSRIGCYTKGKVAGGNFLLIDDNVSGIYGDPLPWQQDNITNGEYPFYTLDAVFVGKSKKAAPYSEFMKIGDKYYRLGVTKTGMQITTTEVALKTGTVRVNWKGGTTPRHVIIQGLDSSSVNSFFDVMAGGKKDFEVPAGKYHIAFGIVTAGKKGKRQLIRLYRGKMKPFHVREGEETVLELGAPFKYEWENSVYGGNFIVKGETINVFGRSGELYARFYDDIPVPLVSIRVKGTNKILVKKEPMKKPTLDDFNKKTWCVWYPLDFTFENKKGADLECTLETKKHKILGGPIVSDWR